MKILEKSEAKKLESFVLYDNGDYSFLDRDYSLNLIRNGVNLLAEIGSDWCFSYENGDYEYHSGDFHHLIRDGIDLYASRRISPMYFYKNGYIRYQSQDFYWHLLSRNTDLLRDKSCIALNVYENLDYEYQDVNRSYHFIQNGIDRLKEESFTYRFFGKDYITYRSEVGTNIRVSVGSLSEIIE